MKQKLLALAAVVAGLGAGVVVFVNFESGRIEKEIGDVGSWELIDRSSVTMSACNTQPCVVAQNHLTDGGSSCIPRLAEADFRVSARMRSCFVDAGVALSATKKYQRVRLVTLRCPGRDGGFAFGVPMDDAGCPIYATALATPLCVRAPLDGGQLCRRSQRDGGFRYYGRGNVFPTSDSNGHAQCEPVSCMVMLGDNPDTDL